MPFLPPVVFIFALVESVNPGFGQLIIGYYPIINGGIKEQLGN
jgi:hypothetical protein